MQHKGRPRRYDPDYPLLGETLGLWKLIEGVGRGGMGEVYAAEYDYLHLLTLRYKPEERGVIRRELERLPREEQARLASEMLGTPLPADARFAIKVCSARKGTAGHRRFLQEAELARRLGDHPYIVSVHAINSGESADPHGGREALSSTSTAVADLALETGKYKDVAFMVMDLAVRDYRHDALSLEEAVHVVRCIATALDHAHQYGVVHRDLKPENILGCVRHPLLTDFGIAKELDQSLGLTRTGQIIGTLDYMSPEQATDAKNVDHLSDIYSLGVVLYEFATKGSLPYIHLAEREACLAAIRNDRTEPRWPRNHVAEFPVGLERIVLKAMAKRKRERYQEMSEFIGDLDRFTRGERIGAWGRMPPRRWLRHQHQVHPRMVWLLAATVILVAGIWASFALRSFFDPRGGELRDRLDYLQDVVEHIAVERRRDSHAAQQLSSEDSQFLERLSDDVESYGADYPAEAARFEKLKRQLHRNRYLFARFTGSPEVDSGFAKQQLALAGNVESQNWNSIASGLLMIEDTPLTLGPYTGHGIKIFIWVQFANHLDFNLTVTEHDTLSANRTGFVTIEAENGRHELQLRHRPFAGGPEVLARSPVWPRRDLRLWLEVYPDRIDATWPNPDSRAATPYFGAEWPRDALQLGEADAIPIDVELLLPKGAILKQIEIFSAIR